MRQLAVYYNDSLAGVLAEKSSGSDYTFQYADDYVNSNLPAISVTFPKRNERYSSEQLFPFFSNMLPEGTNRKTICRLQKIDENDSFGLLSALAGRDFIGAVNVRRLQ
ncbi:MAG: HipA N-terminal domain-containing protein [Muribaculaceae bacterium]|nr:HipA N-terminal domain-containing protein [Muribaculaceae bacterium]